jgi:hypothetical protein
MRSLVFFLAVSSGGVASIAACGNDQADTPAPTSSSAASASGGAAATGVSSGGAGTGGATSVGGGANCDVNEVPLTITIDDGVVDTQIVPIRYGEVDGWLGIDTGSPLTFVFGDPRGPQYVEHAGDIVIGCETLPVPSVTLEAIGVEMFDGKPILGILGVDFFLEHLSELDYPGHRVARYRSGAPSGMNELAPLSFTWEEPRIVVDVSVDRTPLRLVYDTGAHDLIWVGVSGQVGDEEISLGTADGRVFTGYVGSGMVAMGTERPVEVPVIRAPELPYLEDEMAELDTDGLLGMTTMRFRRVVFDFDGERLLLGPVVTAE